MKPLATYLNGQWIEASELHVDVEDLGFVQGVTVSERLRTFRGKLFRVEAHLDRLARSLTIIGLPAAALCEEVRQVLPVLAERISSQLADGDDASVVVFVTPGTVPADDQATLCVYGGAIPFSKFAHLYETGERLVVSSVRQIPTQCWPAELKCRSRMHYYLADLEARRKDPQSRAVLLDVDGFVSEASTANIIAVRGGSLLSPSRDRILPGVSLEFIEDLARENDWSFQEQPLTADDLATAGELMLCSTTSCVLPVVALDGQPISGGEPGTMYRRILSAWSDAVGVDIAAQAARFSQRSAGSAGE